MRIHADPDPHSWLQGTPNVSPPGAPAATASSPPRACPSPRPWSLAGWSSAPAPSAVGQWLTAASAAPLPGVQRGLQVRQRSNLKLQ